MASHEDAMPNLSTELIRKLLPYKEINVTSEPTSESRIYHLPNGPCAEIILKNHFDQLISKGVKLSDIYVSNIIGFDKHCENFSIEYVLISRVIDSNYLITIKPFTPGRRVVTIDKKDGTIDIVSDPTVEELTESIKILGSLYNDLKTVNKMNESAIVASEDFQLSKVNKWETVKKDFGIEDKPKIFPDNGYAGEIVWHRINGLNKRIEVFALSDQSSRSFKVQWNDNNYMILLPFECKRKDAKKIIFEVADGTWEISGNRKLQVFWYKNELIGIVTITNPDNGGTSLSFYKAHHLSFQNGSAKDHGVNGFTNEILLALLMDRFIKNVHNEDDKVIIEYLQNIRLWIYKRTLDKQIMDGMMKDNADEMINVEHYKKKAVGTNGNCPCKTLSKDTYKEYEQKYGECLCKYVRKLKIGERYSDGNAVWEIVDFGIAYDGYTPTYKLELVSAEKQKLYRVKGEDYAHNVDKLCGKI